MKNSVKKEIEKLIKELELNCSIKEFPNKVNFYNITEYQDLSEDFIRKFQDKFDEDCWIEISYGQDLSEEFIREFQDKVDWYWISKNQNLSEEFIIEFRNKIDWNRLRLNDQVKNNYINKLETRKN